MNSYLNRFIKKSILEKRYDGRYVLIKIEIPIAIFKEYFKKETHYNIYFPGGKLVVTKDMFFLSEDGKMCICYDRYKIAPLWNKETF